jgi:hypothetical protein
MMPSLFGDDEALLSPPREKREREKKTATAMTSGETQSERDLRKPHK